ncbi:MAG: hypothetical protein ABIR46_01835 [Candidatus Saccharimonadales bacterium]
MSNKPKKRTKKYQGEDAKVTKPATSEPVVHRFEAVERSKAGDWWQEKKKAVRLGAIATGVVGGGALLITGLLQILF